MDRLILFRHGKTERDSASGEDFDRALTDRGRAEAEAMGRLLAVTGAAPDVALVSSAVRAVQTYEAARAAFPKATAKVSGELYLAAPERLLRLAEAQADARAVMLVAHNPGLHDLALRLARRGGGKARDLVRLEAGFATAAAAVFDFSQGVPELQAFHTPKGG